MGDIPDLNLFMMCEKLNRGALRAMPNGFSIRLCRGDELERWKDLHIDDEGQREAYDDVLTSFFNAVYAPKGDLFFKTCVFVCDDAGVPVGTCFIWKAYGAFNTVHWFKVAKRCEGRGIGRALLSRVMGALPDDSYPVFLHTHPSCYRAIKLYSDFGFQLLTDTRIGHRHNDLTECLPILNRYMPAKDYAALKMASAPRFFLDAVAGGAIDEF